MSGSWRIPTGAIMTDTIEFQSHVGKDGILDLHIPLGEKGADADVVVTIRRVSSQSTPRITDPVQWHRLLDEAYGSCAGQGLERGRRANFERVPELESYTMLNDHGPRHRPKTRHSRQLPSQDGGQTNSRRAHAGNVADATGLVGKN